MALTSGTKLGPYEIQSPLGAGGMGEVYRARDTRLSRDVAIKILSGSFATNDDRLRRFEQETQTIAALNHPNILGIYDVGAHEGKPYLVSEFLDGGTLREKLLAGPLPLRRTIEYALGIAQGLAAAHSKGIVHRDLKPENIFITRDGHIKILDFGLAKLAQTSTTDKSATDTLTNVETTPGVVLGTVGYMSPEQVRGDVADQRSDIFSFGAVLFEMLTGKRAFQRNTSAETMTAILREEPPDLTETGWQGPLGLQRIIARCLEKNVARRFQSASDLGFAIESLSGSTVTQSLPAARTSKLPWVAAAIGLLILAVGALLLGRWSVGQQIQPKFTRLTYPRGYVNNARFAKDGGTVLYSAQWNNDPFQIFSVQTDFPQSAKIDLPSAVLLAMSPADELSVGINPSYNSNFLTSVLAHAPRAGGSPRAIQENVIAADYTPDGKTMAVVRQTINDVHLEFPVGKSIYETAGYLDYVRISPAGTSVAFLEHPVYGDDRGFVSVIDSAGSHRRLTKEYPAIQGLAWARNGSEIWFTAADVGSNPQLYGVDLAGKVRQILTTPQRMRILDIAGDGRVLVASEQYGEEIAAVDSTTGKERKGLEWFDGSDIPDISWDGKAILFDDWGGPAGPLYLVVYRKLDGSAPVAIGPGAQPRLSPDGTTAVAMLYTSPPQIALHPIGTGESRRLPLGDLVTARNMVWFPDGKHLLVAGATQGQPVRSYMMNLEGGKPQPFGPVAWQGIAISKDGKRILGQQLSGEKSVFDLSTQQAEPVPNIQPRETVLRWTEDGQGLLVNSSTVGDAHIYRVELATGKRTLLRTLELADRAGSVDPIRVQVSPDARIYVYNFRRIIGSLYVVEGLH